MQIPSIHFLYKNAKASLHRFPLTIISAFVGVLISIFLIEENDSIKNMFPYINLLLTSGLGISLYFCATVFAIRDKKSPKITSVFNIVATLVLVLIYFSLPTSDSTHNISLPYIKYVIYSVAIHLLVSFIPYISKGHLNGFWNYNKILFTRLWTAAFFSGILFTGLALALLSMKLLFDIDFNEKLYAEIFVVIAGLFNTWYFVSGIPDDFEKLDEEIEFPKGLKIFAQYILLPLLILYFVILYFYGGKILLSWDWPKGIVSYLIICVSVLGILTFLLLYPFSNENEDSWIKKMSKSFYGILLPLLVLLFIAILMRMDDYGITENRYIVLFLGIWLTIVCVFTLIGKSSIKFIPTSLAIMLVLVSFGPWGIFSVSERAQVSRLKHILEKAKIIKQDKIVNESTWKKDSNGNLVASNLLNDRMLNDSLRNEVKSIVNYLDDHHGFSSIRSWFTQNIDSVIDAQMVKDDASSVNEAMYYMKSMGLDYEKYYDSESEDVFTFFYSDADEKITKVSNYDYVVSFDRYASKELESEVCKFTIDSVDYRLTINTSKDNEVKLSTNSELVKLNFDECLKELFSTYHSRNNIDIPESIMTFMSSTSKIEFKISFNTISIKQNSSGKKVENLKGMIFVKVKK
jgi:hypothetical protein